MFKKLYPLTNDLQDCSAIISRMDQAGVFACVKLWKQAASDNKKFNLEKDKLFFMQASYSVYDCFMRDKLNGIVAVSCLFHFFLNGLDVESCNSHLGLQVKRCHASKHEGYDSAFLELRYDYYNWLVTVIIPAMLFKSIYPRACPSYTNEHSKTLHNAVLRHWELISGISARGNPHELQTLYNAFRNDLYNALVIPQFKGDCIKRSLKGIGKAAYAIHKSNCEAAKPL
jgi:hypothetical protein